jgi:transcriptional regulator with XRE-family HTH domain
MDHDIVPRLTRPQLAAEAVRRNHEQLARLGAEVRRSRLRRRLTQAELGMRASLSRSAVSRIELGAGGGHTLDSWQRIGLALGRPFRVDLLRDALEDPRDAGHLAVQELILRLGRAAGYSGRFELSTSPDRPSRSADVGLLDDRRRRLLLVEAWNSVGDVGASARSSDRKLAEADRLAVARWGTADYLVGGCWVVRATRRNRALVARYPELFAARFPGSSRRWVRALTVGDVPPSAPGLVWCDPAAERLLEWRPGRVC